MTTILGLDLGTVKAGWALIDWDTGGLADHGLLLRRGNERAEWMTNMCDDVLSVVARREPAEIGVEAPVVMRQSGADLLLGLHGAVHVGLWRMGRTAHTVAPSVVKKHATGNGQAPKDVVRVAAADRWGVRLSPDEADAAWVADWTRAFLCQLIEVES